MKKIKLFFEDTINLNSSVKKYYSDLIISYLDETYELSEDFGKVMMDEKNKDIMFSNEVIDNKLTNPIIISPNEEIMRKNISSSWSLTGIIERDEIPFFVIDTDGLKISNIAKMLNFENNNIFSYDPRIKINGRPHLLSSFLSSTYKIQLYFKNWGLVLVNPNMEGILYESLRIEDPKIETEIFSKDSSLGLSWLYKGNKKKKAFFSWPEEGYVSSFEKKYSKVAQELWLNHPQIKEQFRTTISMDISEFNNYLIPVMDKIDKKLRNQRPNETAKKNASNTILALYLRKTKKNPDSFPKINNKIVNRKNTPNSNNLEITFYEFGEKINL